MVTTLKKLERATWAGAKSIPPYLLTHPGGPERVSTTEIMLREYPPRQEEKRETDKFRRLFPYFKALVTAKSADPEDAERLYTLELEKNPDSVPALFAMGILRREKLQYADAIAHLEKALSREPETLPILTALAESYQMQGRDERAVRVLEKALKVDDRDKTALFLLAVSYQNLEDYRKSVVFLERLASTKPVRDEVYYHLGMSYGREGKLALAHYNFGLYFKKSGVIEKAGFHFQKAEELAGSDRLLMNKIQTEKEGLRPRN